MKHKIIWAVLMVVSIPAVGWLLYGYFSGNRSTDYFWRTTTIEKGDVSLMVTSTGLVSADTTVEIGTQVSGILSKLYVDYNSRVRKGQIIALIDTTILYANKVDAEAVFERAQAQLSGFKKDLDRQKNLINGQIIPQMEYDVALTNYEVARATVKSMKAQLDRAIINLRYATIKSPINGIVIARNMDVGQTVISNFSSPTLFTIVNNLSKMQVQANVAEADIGEIKMGQDVEFTVDAYPNEIFIGHVQQIRLQPVNIQNVVNYTVIIDADNADLKLMPGLTANINIKIKHRSDIFKVLANALSFMPPYEYIEKNTLFSDAEKKIWYDKIVLMSRKLISEQDSISFIWLKKTDGIYPVKIVKGISDGVFTEIKGPLKEGEQVVTGINQSASSETNANSKNPFMPKMPSRNRRM
jgi:HlyD family secretion protein